MTERIRIHRLRRVRFAIWAGAIVFLLLAGGVLTLLAYMAPPAPRVASVGEADIRSEFSLMDHTGRAVTQADFAGRWQLVFFGFTHCPDICPTTLAYMANVLDLLGPRAGRVAPLFITVDPARDTAPIMAEYVAAFHPRMVGLTGTEAQVASAAQSFRTWYERVEEASAPDGYRMAHAGHIYLMDPDGRFEAVFQEHDQPPDAVAGEILKRIEKEE